MLMKFTDDIKLTGDTNNTKSSKAEIWSGNNKMRFCPFKIETATALGEKQ